MHVKLILLSILLVTFGISQTSQKLHQFIEKNLESPVLKQAQWALYAEYVDSDKIILDINSNMSLTPASGLKLFTTAAALEILGLDFRFETKLYYNGMIDKNGILNGNLYIRGGGDPTLGSNKVNGSLYLEKLMKSWVNAVKKAGITKINGAVVADDKLFESVSIPGNWLWIDLGNYYGAGISALTINDNLYHLFFRPGVKSGMPARVLRTEPEIPELTFNNQMLTGAAHSGDNGYIYRAPGCYQAVLRGTVPAGRKEFAIKGSLPQPALFTARYLKKSLISESISVLKPANKLSEKGSYEEWTQFHSTHSPILADIIYVLNKRSVNLYAEQLLRYLSVYKSGDGTLKDGRKTILKFLSENGIDLSGLHLEDGSGLSPNNLITTEMMVQLLKMMHTKKSFNVFYNSLALAGDANDLGYFKNFGKNTIIEKKCRIKSGLIQGVRSHSGYLTAKSGRLIAFSFIANNFTVPHSKIDKIHETLLIHLAETH